MPIPSGQRPQATAQTLGYANIQLPSRGLLYGDKMPGGVVQQRKMMSSEHARLQQQGGSALERIEAIVNACTKLPEGFSPKDLLLTDSFFLMLALRTQTFGPEYSYKFRCTHCGEIGKASIDIVRDLDEKSASDDLREPIDVKLPDAGCTIQCRFLRMGDQDLITRYVKRTKMASTDADDPSYQYRLALSLESRDGNPFGNLLEKQDFIRSLTAADCIRLERAIQDSEPGVDIRVFPDCSSCGATNEMALPFSAEFFRPTRI